MIKAVLFDMDGILYDSEAYYMQGTIEQMKRFGYTGDIKEVYKIIGVTMQKTYEHLYELLGGSVEMDKIIQSNEHYFSVENPLDYRAIMFDGVKETLLTLKQHNVKLACCSSSPMEVILNSLEAMEIKDCFDFIESGENLEHSKPSPDIYLAAMRELKVNCDECVVYEDSESGIQAGISSGAFTIARRDIRFGVDQSKANMLVDTIQELCSFVLKENDDGRSH